MSEFRRGWKPLTAALFGVACGASPIPFNVIGLALKPIKAETGWSDTQASLAVTLYGVIAALTAPFVGGLADRHGVRPVALWSTLLFGVVFASMWFVPNNLWIYWGYWALVGVIGIGSTPVTWSRAVSLWFERSRGFALGLMLLGTSLAAFIVPQIAVPAMQYGGWRFAFPVLALLPLLVALPIGLAWFREPRPEERPLARGTGPLPGVTLAEAIHGKAFWLLFGSISIVSLAYGGVYIHLAQIAALHGFELGTAKYVVSVAAIGILVGRVGVGLLFDRFWAPGVAFPALLLPALACWMLTGTAHALTPMLAGAFLLGFAAGAETDVVAFMTARYFGLARFGRIYGVLYMAFGVAAGVSPILYGAVSDATGSYDLALWSACVAFVVGGALLLALGPYPRWESPDGDFARTA